MWQIRNLGTFYFAGVEPNDWTRPQNDALWQDGVKTLFDPCPAGWRVPKGGVGSLSPWSAFGSDPYAAPFFYYINGVRQTADGIPIFVAHPNNGRLYENGATKAWYPAPGHRGGGEGAMWRVGSSGYGWSSAVSGIYGYFLDFGYHWLNPSYASYRGHGFPVRCVRE